MPAHVYTTPAAKKRRAIFNMIQMHLKHHLPTLRKTITPKGIGSSYTRYYSLNAKPLARALGVLAEEVVAGKDVSITDVEEAITAYAADHPSEICIYSPCSQGQKHYRHHRYIAFPESPKSPCRISCL